MTCDLKALMDYQRVLMEKFEGIEAGNGLLEWVGGANLVLNSAQSQSVFDNPRFQMKIRRRAWEIVEEIGEALCYAWEGKPHLEEIADAFHFLLELFILCGFTPNAPNLEEVFEEPIVQGRSLPVDFRWMTFVTELTRAINLFRNRPHKQTMRETSLVLLRIRLQNVFDSFIVACQCEGFTATQLADAYSRKMIINEQRIRDGV